MAYPKDYAHYDDPAEDDAELEQRYPEWMERDSETGEVPEQHQPREHAVGCRLCPPGKQVKTWDVSGLCEVHRGR